MIKPILNLCINGLLVAHGKINNIITDENFFEAFA